jgi:hypothetical protein
MPLSILHQDGVPVYDMRSPRNHVPQKSLRVVYVGVPKKITPKACCRPVAARPVSVEVEGGRAFDGGQGESGESGMGQEEVVFRDGKLMFPAS